MTSIVQSVDSSASLNIAVLDNHQFSLLEDLHDEEYMSLIK
jgi:hypothetical protein